MKSLLGAITELMKSPSYERYDGLHFAQGWIGAQVTDGIGPQTYSVEEVHELLKLVATCPERGPVTA